ncbi:MAG: PAS domain S-box protein [Ilumatobacter sp.]|nr:PAS domain S-box protein [Ilumatobacter sp.]
MPRTLLGQGASDDGESALAWLEAVLAGTPDGVLVIDRSGQVVLANERYARLSGYRRDELVGMAVGDLDAVDNRSGVQARHDDAEHVAIQVFDSWHQRKDGSVWPVVVAVTYADVDGGHYVSFVHDASSRHSADNVVRLAADRYRDLLAGSTDGFVRIDADDRIVEVNGRLTEMLGLESDELVGRPVGDVSALYGPPSLAQRLDAARSEAFERFTTTVRPTEGKPFAAEISLTSTGAEGGHVLAFVRDVTDRVEAERLIREGAERFGALLSGTTEAFCMLDTTGVILDVNDEFCLQSGYDRDEMIGRSTTDLASVEGLEHLIELSLEVLEQGSGRSETLLRRKDGTDWPVEISATVSHVEGGRVFTFLHDISERQEAERRIEALAFSDTLTGLPNRARFLDLLRDAISARPADGAMLAVCRLDVDGFAAVNDRLGHEVGDALIVQLGQRLVDEIGDGGVVARFGGDEFILLVTGLADRRQVDAIAGRVLAACRVPGVVDGNGYPLSASMGVTISPDDDGDADALLRHADQAMYQAKSNGRAGSRSTTRRSRSRRCVAVRSWLHSNVRWPTTSSCCTTSHASSSAPVVWSAPRPWCDGNTPTRGCSRPAPSSR